MVALFGEQVHAGAGMLMCLLGEAAWGLLGRQRGECSGSNEGFAGEASHRGWGRGAGCDLGCVARIVHLHHGASHASHVHTHSCT